MKFALDFNRLYALEAEHAENTWRIRLNLPEGTYAPFVRHLSSLIECKTPGSSDAYRLNAEGVCEIKTGKPLEIWLDGHRFGRLTLEDGEIKKKRYDRLTVSETRLIGEMPEGRSAVHANRKDRDAEGVIISDFHTHSSSESTGQDLVKAGLEIGAGYPVRLLEAIGIEISKYSTQEIPRFWFPPLEPRREDVPTTEPGVLLRTMSDDDLRMLGLSLDMRADRQNTTGEMELNYYRLRTPLTKIPEILGPQLLKIAESYKRQGVKYAEITITSPDNPELFKTLHREVPLIKEATKTKDFPGVDLRFLIGLPRTLPLERMESIVEQAKAYAHSPYVMGLDVIGYEVDKIKPGKDGEQSLADCLDKFAAWIHEHEPEFTLRVHAGENAKNLTNVNNVLKIADRHDVRVRIGHGIYGMDDETLKLAAKLAKKGLVVIEFNPDSNLAINNIDSFAEIPFKQCLAHGIPFVVGSDGTGLYQTNAKQLERNLGHMGLGKKALSALRGTQEELIDRQLAYSESKLEAATKEYRNFISHPEARDVYAATLFSKARGIASLLPLPQIMPQKPLSECLPKGVEAINNTVMPEALKTRKPVLLVGASGNSWAGIRKEEQKLDAAAAVDMMVRAMNPKKVYFVLGRVKNEGVSNLLETALERLQRESGNGGKRAPFGVMSLQTPDAIRGFKDDPVHLHYVMPIENNFVALAGRLVRFAKEQDGEIVAIGGSGFTRDIITKARHEGANFHVMSTIKGASKEKGKMLEEHHKAQDAKALLRHLAREHPECMRKELMQGEALDEEALEALYDASLERVKNPLVPHTRIHGAHSHVGARTRTP